MNIADPYSAVATHIAAMADPIADLTNAVAQMSIGKSVVVYDRCLGRRGDDCYHYVHVDGDAVRVLPKSAIVILLQAIGSPVPENMRLVCNQS